MPANPTQMDWTQLVRWYAGLAERTEDDMAAAGTRAAALGYTFTQLLDAANEIRVELQASDMMARTGEVLLGGPRAEVYRSAAEALMRAKRVFAQGTGDTRKLVTVLNVEQAAAVDPEEAEAEQRRTSRLLARDEHGRIISTFQADQLMNVTPIMLAMEINRCADVKKAVQVKRNGRTVVEWLPADFPVRMAAEMMESDVLMRLPQLRGVAHVPIMNPDGSLHEWPGYHEGSRMWLSSSVPEISVPQDPDRSDAERALALLNYLLHTYEFDGPRNMVAAVGGLMTAVLRASMGKAPMVLSTAGQPRTGKDHYLRTCALVSIGGMPMMYGLGERGEEREKRLSQIFHGGAPFVVLSNINGGLANDDLCVFLSEGSVVSRRYGSTGDGKRAEYSGFWSASGNNLEAKGDLVTRCFAVRQVSSNPNPGKRTFSFQPWHWLDEEDNRGEVLAAIYTIARWWLRQGQWAAERVDLGGANDFSEWSLMVREPLFALTQHDVFGATFDAEEEERASEGPGGFNDACGALLAASWRLDYPWDQTDAERRVSAWRRHNEGSELVAPDHIQFCERLSREHAGEMSASDVWAAVDAVCPQEWEGVASVLTHAGQRVRRFLSDQAEDAERGGSEAPPLLAAWMEEAQQALQRVGKSANDQSEAGRMVKKTLDVAGAMWRVTVKRDAAGQPMKGGANGKKPVYRWRRI